MGHRDTFVQYRQGILLKIVWEIDTFFMQFQYPLLFPHAEDGFHIEMSLKKVGKRVIKYPNEEEELFERRHREFVTMKEYYCFKLMIRLCEGISLKNNRTYYNYI